MQIQLNLFNLVMTIKHFPSEIFTKQICTILNTQTYVRSQNLESTIEANEPKLNFPKIFHLEKHKAKMRLTTFETS